MKKDKLKLETIKLESFITTIPENEKETIQGANEVMAAGSWLISGCITSLRCGSATILDNQSATWTKAQGLVGLCANNSRAQLSAINQCPACVNQRATPPAND